MNHYPQARHADLVMQELADEILIYDLKTGEAYCLNQTAAFVWQQLDGATPIKEIARRLRKMLGAPIDEAVVHYAVQTLREKKLLAPQAAEFTDYAALSRRQLISRLGKSAAIAIPLVFSITAPTAAKAGSLGALRANGATCSTNAQCQTGTCSASRCCTNDGRSCSSSAQCCSGTCAGGTCQTLGGGGGGGGCVLFDTPLTAASGKLIKAGEVAVGQELLGVNCFNGAMLAGRVKAKQELRAEAIYALVAESGDVIQCSPSHPLIRGFGDWAGTAIEKFAVGDLLLVHDRAKNRIVEARTARIERIPLAQPVILFEMDTEEHTFVSGGILSHNKIVPCADGSCNG